MNTRFTNPILCDVRSEEDSPGHFSGLAAKFNNMEQANELEVILPGAFKRSLKNQKKFPLLWMHDSKEVIGSFSGYESGRGLEIDGHITETHRGSDAYKLIKAGDVVGLSIGFQAIPDKSESRKNPDGTSYMYLREVKLIETSLVTYPWDKYAAIESIRAEGETEEEEPSKEEWIKKKIAILVDEGMSEEEAASKAAEMYDEMKKDHEAKQFITARFSSSSPDSVRECIDYLSRFLKADSKAEASTLQEQTETKALCGYSATALAKLAKVQQDFWRLSNVSGENQRITDRTR